MGVKEAIENVGVKLDALVPVPAAVVTDTFAAPGSPLGTVALIAVPETIFTEEEASVPNLTTSPGTNPVPVIDTVLPVIPEDGVKELTVGGP